MSPSQGTVIWRPDDDQHPSPSHPGSSDIYRPDILETIEAKIQELDQQLRELSLDIHGMTFTDVLNGCIVLILQFLGHPELGFEEL